MSYRINKINHYLSFYSISNENFFHSKRKVKVQVIPDLSLHNIVFYERICHIL